MVGLICHTKDGVGSGVQSKKDGVYRSSWLSRELQT